MARIGYKRFCSLRSGDLVLWLPGRYYRTVLEGPADKGKWPRNPSVAVVTFPIRRRSWTNQPTTMYNCHDLKERIRAVPKSIRRLMTPDEMEVLVCGGWDLDDLESAVRKVVATNERLGRGRCRALVRALRCLARLREAEA